MEGKHTTPPRQDAPRASSTRIQQVEQALLGALLIDGDAFVRLSQIIDRECFTHPAHVIIYDAMEALHTRGLSIDIVTVNRYLRESNGLEGAGGIQYLSDLSMTVASSAHAETHAKILREDWARRRLTELGNDMQAEKSPLESDVFDEVDRAQEELMAILNTLPTARATDFSVEMNEALKEADKARRDRAAGILTAGIPTGFSRLDALLGGMEPGELHVLAARPSVGKTAFALGLAVEAAKELKKRVLFFSLEMSKRQLRRRMLATLGGLNHGRVLSGELTEEELREAGQRIVAYGPLPIMVDDSARIKLGELCAKAKMAASERGLDFIVIDYLQLITVPDARRSTTREQEVAQISGRLKALAKELNVPVLALSQLNRGVEVRAEKRPALADLRESGAIEQDADAVMMLHAPSRYGIAQYPDGSSTDGVVELLLLKNRKGRCGTVYFEFNGNKMRFAESLAQADRYVQVNPIATGKEEKPKWREARRARARFDDVLSAPPDFVETFIEVEERRMQEGRNEAEEELDAPF